MKDSQHELSGEMPLFKYIKANNERFSTRFGLGVLPRISISRRIMKDSQRRPLRALDMPKYIKANNERFST